MLLGYITNGLADVDAVQAVELLHAIGYRGIGLTLDHGFLNPFDANFAAQLDRTAERLQQLGMQSAIETGARFLLDPHVKHEPTLVSADPAGRARRVEFLSRAIDAAAALGSNCVSCWSGVVRDGAGDREPMDRLVVGLLEVMEHAAAKSVPLAFEPEPGMLIDTMDRFADLIEAIHQQGGNAEGLQLTLDVGHLHCQGELPIADKLHQWADQLVHVHIEDMRRGTHEHLMIGEGEIDFPPVIQALEEIQFSGIIGVELSRHAHLGARAARQAYNFLRPLCDAAEAGGRSSRRA
ncbi:MAG: sugar phosphate isomerase/epimerase family protein [Pirellulales bacterium]